MTTSALTAAIETAAVLVSALAGMISAARKRMDIVGTYCLAVVTALGGAQPVDFRAHQRPIHEIEAQDGERRVNAARLEVRRQEEPGEALGDPVVAEPCPRRASS